MDGYCAILHPPIFHQSFFEKNFIVEFHADLSHWRPISKPMSAAVLLIDSFLNRFELIIRSEALNELMAG